jgi:hypothetical protein
MHASARVVEHGPSIDLGAQGGARACVVDGLASTLREELPGQPVELGEHVIDTWERATRIYAIQQ